MTEVQLIFILPCVVLIITGALLVAVDGAMRKEDYKRARKRAARRRI